MVVFGLRTWANVPGCRPSSYNDPGIKCTFWLSSSQSATSSLNFCIFWARSANPVSISNWIFSMVDFSWSSFKSFNRFKMVNSECKQRCNSENHKLSLGVENKISETVLSCLVCPFFKLFLNFIYFECLSKFVWNKETVSLTGQGVWWNIIPIIFARSLPLSSVRFFIGGNSGPSYPSPKIRGLAEFGVIIWTIKVAHCDLYIYVARNVPVLEVLSHHAT